MGWAKYAEDNNEIILERMDQMENRKSQYIEIITAIPLKACPIGISIEVNSDEKQVEPKAKYEDKNLHCQDCGKGFVFSVGEQRFYEEKGFHQPKRCRTCRETNKIKQLAFSIRGRV